MCRFDSSLLCRSQLTHARQWFSHATLSLILFNAAWHGMPTSVLAQDNATAKPCGQSTCALLPREIAELEIALGRMRLVPDRFRIVRKHDQFASPEVEQQTGKDVPNSSSKAEPALSCSRSLQVAAVEGRPTLRMSYSDPHEKWTLSIDQIVGAEWSREYIAEGHPVKVEYVQRPHKPIAITISVGSNKPQTLTGQTLWHLTEQSSPEFQQYVLPALVRLNPSWDLPQALAAAKRMKSHCDLTGNVNCKHELAQCIAELDSADRNVRQVAKSKLRAAGLAAQIPLEQLLGGPLSSQQRSTIDELLSELEPRSADTPTRLAYWLSGDPSWK